MFEAHHETVLADVGQCIYCGTHENLTDEHIIPLALNGNLVIANASCKKCAKITSAFEEKVLRGFMLDARTVGKFKTRRPKQRPKRLKIGRRNAGGDIETVFVTPENHPGFLVLPRLARAHVFGGNPPLQGVTVEGYETIYFGATPEHAAKELDTKTIQFQVNWDVSSFARMLAKIAYAYAIGVHGLLPRNKVPILPLILGTADDASTWLGSAEYILDIEQKRPIHALATAIGPGQPSGKHGVVARVKLFASSGATGYEVLVLGLSLVLIK